MGLNSRVINGFKNSFEAQCFRLLSEAYNSVLSKNNIQSNWYENDISAELHKYINENPLRLKWEISTNVEHHIPNKTQKTKGFANEFLRIDFRFVTFNYSKEYCYFFEAKNLKEGDSKLNRRYISTGIDSFKSGKKYPKGTLVGYIIKGSVENIVSQINLLLEKDKRSSESLITYTNEFFEYYYESTHPNINKQKHIMLDFKTK